MAETPSRQGLPEPHTIVRYTETGNTVWTDNPDTWISSLALADGKLYVSSSDTVYCYGDETTFEAQLTCSPPPGEQSLEAMVNLSLTNFVPDATRRFVYQINVTEPDGTFDLNWRRGWQNVAAGETYFWNWWQNIPALGALQGTNIFELKVFDVTPAPYNLPPYPPAGDTAVDQCTITASN